MMMMTRLVTACVMVAGLAVSAMAQTTGTTNMEILRQKVKADKKLVVAENLNLTDADYAKATAPILAIHGRLDRSSSYGGGREWAMRLPNARLVTMDHAAHVPWIEDPDKVFSALEAFLNGEWPEQAVEV